VLEARRVLLAQGIAIVEGALPLLRVACAVEEQAGSTFRGKTREPACEREEERELLAAIEGAARIVPAVPRERGGETEPLSSGRTRARGPAGRGDRRSRACGETARGVSAGAAPRRPARACRSRRGGRVRDSDEAAANGVARNQGSRAPTPRRQARIAPSARRSEISASTSRPGSSWRPRSPPPAR
jgi:hypothetical protein